MKTQIPILSFEPVQLNCHNCILRIRWKILQGMNSFRKKICFYIQVHNLSENFLQGRLNCFLRVQTAFWGKPSVSILLFVYLLLNLSEAWGHNFGRVVETAIYMSRGTFWGRWRYWRKVYCWKRIQNMSEIIFC